MKELHLHNLFHVATSSISGGVVMSVIVVDDRRYLMQLRDDKRASLSGSLGASSAAPLNRARTRETALTSEPIKELQLEPHSTC
jgi:hypothetical protein